MKLHEILSVKGTEVHTATPGQSLADVVEILMKHRIGSLVVRDPADAAGAKVIGIITERDILRACADRRSLEGTAVVDYMTTNPVTSAPNDSVESAMGSMTRNRIRHLPVVEDGNLKGMISIGDVVKAKHDHLSMENHFLKNYIQS